MERVLLPMEPVEPRMANFFTLFIFADWDYLRAFGSYGVAFGQPASFESGANFVAERVERYWRPRVLRDPSLRSG